jgi:hypothetical protein
MGPVRSLQRFATSLLYVGLLLLLPLFTTTTTTAWVATTTRPSSRSATTTLRAHRQRPNNPCGTTKSILSFSVQPRIRQQNWAACSRATLYSTPSPLSDNEETDSVDETTTTTTPTTTPPPPQSPSVVVSPQRTTFDQAGKSLMDEQDNKRMEAMGDFDANPNVRLSSTSSKQHRLVCVCVFQAKHTTHLVCPPWCFSSSLCSFSLATLVRVFVTITPLLVFSLGAPASNKKFRGMVLCTHSRRWNE